MEIELIVALIALIGVLASAIVQYRLGKHSERNKKFVDLRFQSYIDLINAVSEIASAAKHGKARTLDQLQALTKAKTRVVLVGSDNVVLAAHNFFSKHEKFDSTESTADFTFVVAAMRKDISGGLTVPTGVLNESLFGKN